MQISVYSMTPYYSGLKLHDAESVLMERIDQITSCGSVTEFNLASYLEKLEYCGPQEKAVRYRDSHERMMKYALSRIPYVTTTGVQLLKYHGLSRRDSLEIEGGPVYVLPEFTGMELASDERGHISYNGPLIDALKTHPKRYDSVGLVIKLMVSVKRPGSKGDATLYIKWPNNSVLQKGIFPADGIPRQYVYIHFDGLNPHHFEYYGVPGDILTIHSVDVRAQLPNELDSNGNWVGNDASGFFHCRRPDNLDIQGIMDSIFKSGQMQKVRQVLDWEEDNSPWPYKNQDRIRWIGELTALTANILYRLTGNAPVFFRTDPRKHKTEQIFHRACVRGLSIDYLDYVPIDTPMTILNWFEGADPEFVAAEEFRTRNRSRKFGWYAGTQNIESILDGLRFNKQDIQAQSFVICYNDVHWTKVLSDIEELKRLVL